MCSVEPQYVSSRWIQNSVSVKPAIPGVASCGKHSGKQNCSLLVTILSSNRFVSKPTSTV